MQFRKENYGGWLHGSGTGFHSAPVSFFPSFNCHWIHSIRLRSIFLLRPFLISGVILTLLVFQDLEILLAELRIGLIENSRFHDESYHFHVCMPILKVTIVIFNEFLFFLRDKFSLKESTFEGNRILNFYTEIMISIVFTIF